MFAPVRILLPSTLAATTCGHAPDLTRRGRQYDSAVTSAWWHSTFATTHGCARGLQISGSQFDSGWWLWAHGVTARFCSWRQQFDSAWALQHTCTHTHTHTRARVLSLSLSLSLCAPTHGFASGTSEAPVPSSILGGGHTRAHTRQRPVVGAPLLAMRLPCWPSCPPRQQSTLRFLTLPLASTCSPNRSARVCAFRRRGGGTHK